jgi:hypothetical protein
MSLIIKEVSEIDHIVYIIIRRIEALFRIMKIYKI